MSLILDDNGLRTQTQEELVAELTAKLRANPSFGPNLKTDPGSLMGGIVHAVCELRAIDQQTLLAVYNSFDPNGARGRALDARAGLTGTKRLGALPSVVIGLLTFNAAGTAPQGALIKNTTDSSLWKLVNGPLTVAAAGTIAAQFTCTKNGPVLANAGTTWSLVTTVPHLVSFTNPAFDAKRGRLMQEDPDLRKKRLIELFTQGQGPLATIKAQVSKVPGVLAVRVYHNPTVIPEDADGIPFKAFNVVLETTPAAPPADLQQAIFNAIWSATGAGGRAYGTSYPGLVIDSEGQNQPSAFDVVKDVEITIHIDLVTSTNEDPITPNLNAAVAAAILAQANRLHSAVGRDVRALDYQGIVQAMLADKEISGVDAAIVKLCRTATPPAALVQKLAIGVRERAKFSSVNVTVAQV